MAEAAEKTPAADTPETLPAISEKADLSDLDGPQKAAIILLALGADYGQHIWSELDDDDVVAVSLAMSRIGNIEKETTEALLAQFISNMSMAGALVGTATSTERLLAEYLPPDRLSAIMEEIRGPAGRNMWEKLSNVQATVLANYLKNEYPQTVAVIFSKISTDHAAQVLSILPEDFALEVVQRMLAMESVQRDVLEKIEHTLRNEFISNLSQTQKRDAHELLAEIFNSFDRQTETRFLHTLEEADWDAAERIKTLMFTFDDLGKLDKPSVQTLLRAVEHDKLVLAMKGAAEPICEFFFSNMSERAAGLLKDDLEVLGPVRLKDVDDAQTQMVNLAKDLAAKGDIIINKGNDDDLVY
ncbi:MAG: flagellar motor switch protein FliG [Hyphomicrobiales bacterium]|nr:flagellar motor switch protein FliG [Hyphomicrobiales bacterium]